jgi:hypothetical protein
MKPKKS